MTATAAALNDLTTEQASETTETTETVLPPQKRDGGGAKIPEALYVLDTTAHQLTGHEQEDRAKGRGARTHSMIVDGIAKPFKFEPGVALSLPFAIAIKFLKTKGFICTDKDGNRMPYSRQPRQPEEYGAGERFELKDSQTVAAYDELTNMAIYQRVLELPGGEKFRVADEAPNRKAMVDFIKKSAIERREANKEKIGPRVVRAPVLDDDSDEFTPSPASDEEMEGMGDRL